MREMKKLSVILIALVAIFAVSCKNSDPVQKMVDAVNSFTEKLQKVDSQEALVSLQTEMAAEIEKLEAEAKKELGENYQPTPEQEKLVSEAMEKFQAAAADVVKKFAPEQVEENTEEAEGEEAKAESEEAPAEGEAAPEAPAEGE